MRNRAWFVAFVSIAAAGCSHDAKKIRQAEAQIAECETLYDCRLAKQRAAAALDTCLTHKTFMFGVATGSNAQLLCSDAQPLYVKAEARVTDLEEAMQRRQAERQAAAREEAEDERDEALADKKRQFAANQEKRRAKEATAISAVLAACASSEHARAARARHLEALRSGIAAEFVRKRCREKHETETVRTECKDANGFSRTCSRQVAGDLLGYVCAKELDAEMVKLGLFALDHSSRIDPSIGAHTDENAVVRAQDYPFPEERGLPSNTECAIAADTAQTSATKRVEASEQ